MSQRDSNIDINRKERLFAAKKEKETKSAELKKLKSEKEAKVNNLTDEQFNLIITKLKKYKDTTDWKKDNGKYIPYPTTWLNQKRWEDDVVSISESNNPNNVIKYSDEWWNRLGSDSND